MIREGARRRIGGLAVLVALPLCLACGAPDFEPKTVEHGRLYAHQGLWILELDGTPAQRGEAAGQLVGEQIRWALPRYLRETLHTDEPTGYPLEVARKLEGSIPAAHLEELDALARSAGIDRDLLLLVNLVPEVSSALACSCLAATEGRSGTGAPLLGRNLDWHGGRVLEELGLVVVVKGSGHPFVSLTWPGLVGVVTGMNVHGLAAANLVVLGPDPVTGRVPRPAVGVPVMFALRQILEQEADVESAVARLKRLRRTVPQNYALADRAGAVVLETARSRFRRRDPEAGFVAVANLFDEDRYTRPGSRFTRMTRVGAQPTLDVAGLEAALAEVAMDDLNVQAVVFEPAARTFHLATGGLPAAGQPYHRVDAGALLGAPPPPAGERTTGAQP